MIGRSINPFCLRFITKNKTTTNTRNMKLPNTLEGIHREGRTDSLAYSTDSGLQPQFLGGWGKKLACKACNLIPNATLKAACKARAC